MPANVPRLLPVGNEAGGLLTSTLALIFTPTEPGDYKVRLSGAEAGPLIALLVIFWVGRKAAGVF